MAQTKRKRRSKHRGTAAGTIEARGRTGRKPEPSESRPARGGSGRDRRLARMEQPPTWRGALNRALIASGVFFIVMIALLGQPVVAALSLSVFMLAIYIPMGYYTDLFLHRRRQAKKGGGKADGGKAER